MRRDVVVLDTDVLLWWFAVDPRLSVLADEAIRKATTVLVSPITFWEVAMLVCKGRVELDRPTKQWTNDVLASPRVEQAALTPEVAVTAAELVGMHGDLADRILPQLRSW